MIEDLLEPSEVEGEADGTLSYPVKIVDCSEFAWYEDILSETNGSYNVPDLRIDKFSDRLYPYLVFNVRDRLEMVISWSHESYHVDLLNDFRDRQCRFKMYMLFFGRRFLF